MQRLKKLILKLISKLWFKYYLKEDEFHHSLDIRKFETDAESELFVYCRQIAHYIDINLKHKLDIYLDIITKDMSWSELIMLIQIMFNKRGKSIDDILNEMRKEKL